MYTKATAHRFFSFSHQKPPIFANAAHTHTHACNCAYKLKMCQRQGRCGRHGNALRQGGLAHFPLYRYYANTDTYIPLYFIYPIGIIYNKKNCNTIQQPSHISSKRQKVRTRVSYGEK